jgi:hypothetical protein
MRIEQVLGEALDQTIHALAMLDLDALESIEQRLTTLAPSRRVGDEIDADCMVSLIARKCVLEQVLYHSELNLNALRRLHGRNMRDLWQR